MSLCQWLWAFYILFDGGNHHNETLRNQACTQDQEQLHAVDLPSALHNQHQFYLAWCRHLNMVSFQTQTKLIQYHPLDQSRMSKNPKICSRLTINGWIHHQLFFECVSRSMCLSTANNDSSLNQQRVVHKLLFTQCTWQSTIAMIHYVSGHEVASSSKMSI